MTELETNLLRIIEEQQQQLPTTSAVARATENFRQFFEPNMKILEHRQTIKSDQKT
jgi:hypothetical protein